jgi:hypothetical protein
MLQGRGRLPTIAARDLGRACAVPWSPPRHLLGDLGGARVDCPVLARAADEDDSGARALRVIVDRGAVADVTVLIAGLPRHGC